MDNEKPQWAIGMSINGADWLELYLTLPGWGDGHWKWALRHPFRIMGMYMDEAPATVTFQYTGGETGVIEVAGELPGEMTREYPIEPGRFFEVEAGHYASFFDEHPDCQRAEA